MNRETNTNIAPQEQRPFTEETVRGYGAWLKGEEKSAATVEKYLREARGLLAWLNGRAVTKEAAVAYKGHLCEKGRAPAGVNGALAALNGFFAYAGLGIKLKYMKIQRKTFLDAGKLLTRREYAHLLGAARRKGDRALWLVLQVICSTGIRVGELEFITVEAARRGRAVLSNKGKTRSILLPEKLPAALLEFARAQGIATGSIFLGKGGAPMDRRTIWAAMKKLCGPAGVPEGKVFPHSLRRLFAREFYGRYKDIVRLADILGHSDVRTTRVYVMDSGREHQRLLDGLRLTAGW
jgi:integrase